MLQALDHGSRPPSRRRSGRKAVLHALMLSSMMFATGCSPQELIQLVTSLAGGVGGATNLANPTAANPAAATTTGATTGAATGANPLTAGGNPLSMFTGLITRLAGPVTQFMTPNATGNLTQTGTAVRPPGT